MEIISIIFLIVFLQSDSEVLWRILKDWLTVLVPLAALAGIIFAVYRGKSYTELERLAATRKEEIADLTAKLARRDERIRHLEDEAEFARMKELRAKGDEDHIHRSKG